MECLAPSRKRKPTDDLIFEVNDGDCSPLSATEIEEAGVDRNAGQVLEPGEIQVQEPGGSPGPPDTPITAAERPADALGPVTQDEDMSMSEEELTADTTTPGNNCQDSNKPLLTVSFRDPELALANKAQISCFLRTLLGHELREEFDLSNAELKFWSEEPAWNGSVVEDLFTVDTTPSKQMTREFYPRYSRKCEFVEKDETNGVSVGPSMMCFNCNGNHALRDCKQWKDYRRINMARNRMRNKAVRYHLEDDKKFAHFVPGKISENLRKALSLHRYEIPGYVYKMRVLGYPPGWLEEAKITDSCLSLFDFQGSPIAPQTEAKTLDADKVVEYSGFNVPFEKHFKDEYRRYKCPPFSRSHSKQAMMEFFDKMNAKPAPRVDLQPIVALGCESDDVNQKLDRQSPSLNDLEIRKQQLLAELDDSTSSPAVTEGPPILNRSTSVSFGTPILKSASSYEHLPDPDNFSKDITQVINFENLPDSVGKYEQMSKVIGKIRQTIKSTSDRS